MASRAKAMVKAAGNSMTSNGMTSGTSQNE